MTDTHDLLPWAFLVALMVLGALGVLNYLAQRSLLRDIRTELQRLSEDRASLTAWFQGTSVRLELAEKDARQALLKHHELAGQVASVESRLETYVNRIHGLTTYRPDASGG